MSKYELDDNLVRRALETYTGLDRKALYEELAKQLPVPEPDREYLLKDKDGDIWRWDVRQSAWGCITTSASYLSWPILAADCGPLTIYGPVS